MIIYKGKIIVPGGDHVEIHVSRASGPARVAVRSGDGWRWAEPVQPGPLASNTDDRIMQESQVIREMVRERDGVRRMFEAILGRRFDPNERTEDLAAEVAEAVNQMRGVMADEQVGPFNPGSVEAYHAAITARVREVPGVIRVHRPDPLLLRALLAEGTDAAIVDATREALAQVVDDNEVRIIVQVEPGEPPPGYEIREDEANDGEAGEGPHGVHPGAPPSTFWATFEWILRAADGVYCGTAWRTKAKAIDEAWEDFAQDIGEGAEEGEGA